MPEGIYIVWGESHSILQVRSNDISGYLRGIRREDRAHVSSFVPFIPERVESVPVALRVSSVSYAFLRAGAAFIVESVPVAAVVALSPMSVTNHSLLGRRVSNRSKDIHGGVLFR